jgi:hypothetical protein
MAEISAHSYQVAFSTDELDSIELSLLAIYALGKFAPVQ